jgi:hypothetical protein
MALGASGTFICNGYYVLVTVFCQPHTSGDGRHGLLLKTSPTLPGYSLYMFTQGMHLFWWNVMHSPASVHHKNISVHLQALILLDKSFNHSVASLCEQLLWLESHIFE